MRRAFSTTISTGSGSATVGLSPPAIMNRKSKDRGPSCPVTFRSTASRPTSSAAPSPTAPAGADGSTEPAPACSISPAPKSRTARLPERTSRSPGQPTRSSCSSSRSRARVASAFPTATSCGSATPARTAAIMSRSGGSFATAGSFLRAAPTCRRSRTGSAPIPTGKALMRENTSYIFFQELTGPGPLGSLGVAITPRGTVAADPNFVPLGAPVFSQDGPSRGRRLVGRAGRRRCDQGTQPLRHLLGRWPGSDALAGGMSASGRALILLPKGVAAGGVRPLSPEEAKLWAEVAATIRPLSRERSILPRTGRGPS